MRITKKGYIVLCQNCFFVSRHFSEDTRFAFIQNFVKVLALSFDNFDMDKFYEAFEKETL